MRCRQINELLFVLFVLVWGVAPSGALAVEVNDPRNVLGEVRYWYGGHDFETAFQCPKSARFTSKSARCTPICTEDFCSCSCDPYDDPSHGRFEFYLEDCEGDQAYIYSSRGLSIPIHKGDYVSVGNHWLVPFLKAVPHFVDRGSEIDLERAQPSRLTYIKNGERRELSTVEVKARYFLDRKSQSCDLTVHLASFQSGLTQIVLVKFSGTTLLKMEGIVGVD